MNDDLLDVESIGTLERPDTAKLRKPKKLIKENKTMSKEDKKTMKYDFNQGIQRFAGWLDRNLLPYVALVALSGFAYKGVSAFLPEMNDAAQSVLAVAGVAIMVVKLKASKV